MLGGFRPRIGEGVLCWVVLDLDLNRRGYVGLGGFRPRIGEGVLGWVVLDLE